MPLPAPKALGPHAGRAGHWTPTGVTLELVRSLHTVYGMDAKDRLSRRWDHVEHFHSAALL